MTIVVSTTGISSSGQGMSLLELVQTACAELGLGVPTSVAGNLSSDTVQMLALTNAVGRGLQREFDWELLAREYRFTTQFASLTGTLAAGSAVVTGISSTAGLDTTYMVNGIGINQDTYILSVDSATQVTLTQPATTSVSAALAFGKTKYALPSDYDRQQDNTQYDKSKRWQMLGPETPQQWQFLKSSYISTGPRLRYRIMGGFFQIWPAVSTAEYLGFEYLSNGWAVATSGSVNSKFVSDTDTCVFPDVLMVLGLKLKYMESKGFDTTAIYRDYCRQLDIAKANDHGSPTLSMSPRLAEVLIGMDNIPDTGLGQ